VSPFGTKHEWLGEIKGSDDRRVMGLSAAGDGDSARY